MLCCAALLLDYGLGPLQATIHYPGVRLVIEQVASGRIILEAHLGHLQLGIHSHPQLILAMVQVTDVHPLAIYVVLVDVVAVDGNALVTVIRAKVLLLYARLTLVILQAEACLVPLSYTISAFVQDVERGEYLHAVVMPGVIQIDKNDASVRSLDDP